MRVTLLAGLVCGTAWAQTPAIYDWGMVRAYFSGGAMFSGSNAEFSKQDVFLGFTMDKTWLYRPDGPRPYLLVSSFFDARMTSMATDNQPEHRTAQVSGGFYAPLVTTEWLVGGKDRQALFVAPLLKGGFVGGAERFYAAGVRLGHFSGCGAAGVAPETLSYLDVAWGRWLTVEGRLKVPGTPLMVGFDATSGSGRDDLRILLGTRFDIGKLAQKLQAPQQ